MSNVCAPQSQHIWTPVKTGFYSLQFSSSSRSERMRSDESSLVVRWVSTVRFRAAVTNSHGWFWCRSPFLPERGTVWTHDFIQYPSRRFPDSFLEFQYHSGPNPAGSTAYRCKHCAEMKKRARNLGPVPCLTVRNGNITTNPDFPHSPRYCAPVPSGEGRAQNVS